MWIFCRLKYKFQEIKSWIKGKSFQLIHGFDYRDTWSLDYSLAKWMLPRLKYLKEHKQGVPCEFFGGSLEYQESDKGFKDAEERWARVLDEIIWTFDFLLNMDDIHFKVCYPEDYDFGFKTDGCSKLIWNDDRKPDLDKFKPYMKRFENGMILFAKNIQNLWD